MIATLPTARRPVEFIASAKRDLAALPDAVKAVFGFAIFQAELGEKHPDAKPLKGFGGGGVLEVVDDHDGNAYRAIYTVKFEGVVYVLHAFQKKSKKGVKTDKRDIDLIKSRLKIAEQHYAKNYRRKETA
jgi:phage-related protein